MKKHKKDAYYFSHDANAQDDPKCMLLIEQLGMEGYGVFWSLVEKLRQEPTYRLPLAIIPALATRWRISKEKIDTVIKGYGLFEVLDDKFFSLRLMRSMKEYEEKRKKYINAGKKGGQASVKHRLSIPQALLEQPSTIKGKEIKGKGKEIEVNEDTPPTPLEGDMSELDKIWLIWEEYRKSIRKPINTVSRGIAKQELKNLSGGDLAVAEKIINQSIANGWQGLFAINTKQNGKETIRGNPPGIAEQVTRGKLFGEL